MISKDKQYRTRSGYEVRIYATDGTYPDVVHGAYLGEHGWAACLWLSSGSAKEGYLRSYDLVEIKPRPKMMTDDLVTRLREVGGFDPAAELCSYAADRIEELESALRKWLHYDCGPYDSGTDMTRDYLDALNATRAAMGWKNENTGKA